MPATKPFSEAPGYQLFMLVLSLFALAIVGASTLGHLLPETVEILGYADFAVCILFLFDFVVQLAHARNRARYFLTWGWLDLLSSIPLIGVTRYGRVARAFRTIRVLHSLWAAREITRLVMKRRAENAMLVASTLALMLITFASIAILHVENTPDANIKTAQDALWWSMTTITTVGYGDRFPVTREGRMVAILLMTAGVGLFGTFSAFLASWFLGGAAERDLEHQELAAIRHEVKQLREELQARSSSR